MLKKSLLFIGLAMACVMLVGCAKKGTDENADGEVPPPLEGEVQATPGEWAPGANDKSVGAGNGGAAGEWTPVPGGLNFPVIYFGFNLDEVDPSQTASLDKVAGYLNKHAQLGLIIEGHCDQRGTEEYNRALGERRANSIRAYLTGKGLADSRIKTLSFGKDRPAVEGSGEDAWKKNRRGMLIPATMNK
ncbi:MAG: OmpA family protein [Victivallaceae bacterium]|nr:OmpA family protein [Victivallaceae bacterium]